MRPMGGISKTLRVDVIAGLTAAAVVLPKAMAYATVAGLPVEVGLYTAFLPMAIYALLGSSRVLSASSHRVQGRDWSGHRVGSGSKNVWLSY